MKWLLDFTMQFLKIEFVVMERTISLYQIFVFYVFTFLVLKLVFGLSIKGGANGSGDYD